jgi:hypothetical protein
VKIRAGGRITVSVKVAGGDWHGCCRGLITTSHHNRQKESISMKVSTDIKAGVIIQANVAVFSNSATSALTAFTVTSAVALVSQKNVFVNEVVRLR